MSFRQSSKPTRCCGACGHARITSQRGVRHVEKSIRTSGVGRARSQQKSRARIVDGIVFYDVVDPAGRRPGRGQQQKRDQRGGQNQYGKAEGGRVLQRLAAC
jgi:hypothetical protein